MSESPFKITIFEPAPFDCDEWYWHIVFQPTETIFANGFSKTESDAKLAAMLALNEIENALPKIGFQTCKTDKRELVDEFRKAMSLPRNSEITPLSKEEKALHIRLLKEELGELEIAIEADDIAEELDGAGDLLYILHGYLSHRGISAELFDHVFALIHASNMTKVWPDGTVKKDEGGKVLKPPTFERPKIKEIFD